MADTLEIFGTEYTNVAGIIATDDNGNELTYTRGGFDAPTFTVTWDSNYENIISVTCDMTFSEISASEYNEVGVIVEEHAMGSEDVYTTFAKYIDLFSSSTKKQYFVYIDGTGYSYDITYNSNGTINATFPSSFYEELSITANGTYAPSESYNILNRVTVNVSGGSSPTLQNKTVSPSESQQSVQADSGYDGLDTVTVNAMPSGTAGTPTATKGTVSNHTVSITPSVTNTTGYITGSTINGTAVTVSASELVSGTYSVTSSGTKDVTNYASISVPEGYVGFPTATKSAVSNHSVSVEPNVVVTSNGYVEQGLIGGTAITVSASELVSGNKAISNNGTDIDVTNYATVSVAVGSDVNNQNKTVTPTESQQSITADSGYSGLGTVTVNAISSTYIGSSINQLDSTDLTVSGATVTAPAGYYAETASKSVSTMTLPTSAASSATSGYTSKATIGRSTAAQYINIPPGYNSAGAYYVISAVANGSATGPTSLSSSSATITTGTNTITLTKTGVSTTPTVSAGYISDATASTATVALTASVTVNPTPTVSGATVTIPAGYYSSQTTKSVDSGSATAPASISGTAASVSTDTNTLTLTKTVSVTPVVSAGYVSAGTAGNSSVSLTANITTKAAATYHPSTTDQTISASQYLTGTQTIKAVTITNLTAANIKKDVVVKIGDATDDDCVTTITGTYEGSGGGTALTVDTSTTTLNSAAASISFTGLAGEPTSFAVVSAADLATGASPWKTAAVIFDGTDLHGQTIRNTSNAQVSYDGTAFSKTYSNGTLTITGSGTNFQANQYKLVYTYGGSDISTADVQVGSGATSITFTNLDDEPSYFSCIFKSNFSTSSGYQRVITVVYDGTNTYGMEMDSSAKYSDAHWSYSYSGGSLTITSSGTNAGGYFHQPGYYQLTYATEGESGNYQTKSATYYATSSQQTASIAADSGYDALKKVIITIAPVTTTNLIASNIVSGVTVQVGDAVDSDRIASVTGNVVLQNYYTGSSAPSSSLGSNGDLYLQS